MIKLWSMAVKGDLSVCHAAELGKLKFDIFEFCNQHNI